MFRRLKLDFCCGGQQSLDQACTLKGLNATAVLDEIRALQQSEAAPETPQPGALIDHILARYHETHRRELPELARLARRVEAVHAEHAEAPHGLADGAHGRTGALLVGLLEAFSSYWASGFKEVIVFTLIIPVLLWRSLWM